MKLRSLILPLGLLLLSAQCEDIRNEPCVAEQVVVNGQCYNVCRGGKTNLGPCDFLGG